MRALGRLDVGVMVMPQRQTIAIHDISELAAVREWLDRALQDHAIPREARSRLVLCVHEVCANALRFGGSPRGVTVSVRFSGTKVEAIIRDHGNGFDPTRLGGVCPGPTCESGRGLFLLRALMDHVEVHVNHGTEVRLLKLVPAGSRLPSRAAR
jgi:serine/threonine-protein kinase RsbW